MTENSDHEIAGLADALARANAEADAAGAALTAAQERYRTISGRLDDVRSARAVIVARRMSGDHRDDDGAALALADADAEGLALLLSEASGEVAAAQAAAEAARVRRVAARVELDNLEADRRLAAWAAHAAELGERLLAAVRELQAGKDARREPLFRWHPAQALVDQLHVMAFNNPRGGR